MKETLTELGKKLPSVQFSKGDISDSYGEPIHDELPFTLGKVYQSLETPFKGVYKIIGDDNLMYVVNKNSFTTLQLCREHKIDLILK